jgi:uncharacterized protein (DUF736 family)
MIIGVFHSAEDGFVGQLFFMGLDQVPIAAVPLKPEKSFAFLLAGKTMSTSIEIGRGVGKQGKDGAYLEVKIDGPILPGPVTATMDLKPSREGIYTLIWKRPAQVGGEKPKTR